MPIGSSQRDSRRRRVLMDDSSEESSARTTRKRKKSSSEDDSQPLERLYTDSALVDHHPPITSIIPKKLWVLALILMGLVLMVAGLNWLNNCCEQWADQYGAQLVMAFDMMAGQGLVKWMSSFLLAVGAFYCVQIHLIRRHRNDDYRATYRLWGWLAFFMLLVSLNATANIHEIVFNLARDFARAKTGFDSKAGWWMIVSLPLAIIVGRVLFEICESMGAVAALLLSCAAFVFAFMIKADAVELSFINNVNRNIVECNSMLVGYISLFYTTAVYSRFVYRDSQGLLVEKMAKRLKSAEARQAKKAEREAAKAEKKVQREEAAAKREEESKARKQKREAESAAKKAKSESKTTSRSAKSSKESTKQKTKKPSTKATTKATPKSKPSESQSSKSSTKPRSKTKPNRQSDPSRTIPDFQEVSDSDQDISDAPATISMTEMQEKLAGAKSRSERKRLKKLIQREQRRAA